MSQRNRDWNNRDRRNFRGGGGGGGGRFQRGSDRYAQRGRGYGGRPIPPREFGGPLRDRFDDFESSRSGSALWTRNRRPDVDIPTTSEQNRPPDLRFINTEDWRLSSDNLSPIRRSTGDSGYSMDRKSYLEDIDPTMDINFSQQESREQSPDR